MLLLGEGVAVSISSYLLGAWVVSFFLFPWWFLVSSWPHGSPRPCSLQLVCVHGRLSLSGVLPGGGVGRIELCGPVHPSDLGVGPGWLVSLLS